VCKLGMRVPRKKTTPKTPTSTTVSSRQLPFLNKLLKLPSHEFHEVCQRPARRKEAVLVADPSTLYRNTESLRLLELKSRYFLMCGVVWHICENIKSKINTVSVISPFCSLLLTFLSLRPFLNFGVLRYTRTSAVRSRFLRRAIWKGVSLSLYWCRAACQQQATICETGIHHINSGL